MIKRLHVAVCDDDFNSLDGIVGAVESMLSRKGITSEVEGYKSVSQLEERLKLTVFDVILLDIDMPDTDGISFGIQLREANDKTEIIYVSNREDRVFEAFTVRPFAFVRKSNFLKDVAKALSALIEELEKRNDCGSTLILQGKDGILSVSLANVIYFEGCGKVQLLHTEDKNEPLIIHSSMNYVESATRDKGFLRIHKGFLLNYRYISAIAYDSIELVNGETLPLSRRKSAEIRAEYLALMQTGGSLLF